MDIIKYIFNYANTNEEDWENSAEEQCDNLTKNRYYDKKQVIHETIIKKDSRKKANDQKNETLDIETDKYIYFILVLSYFLLIMISFPLCYTSLCCNSNHTENQKITITFISNTSAIVTVLSVIFLGIGLLHKHRPKPYCNCFADKFYSKCGCFNFCKEELRSPTGNIYVFGNCVCHDAENLHCGLCSKTTICLSIFYAILCLIMIFVIYLYIYFFINCKII